MVSARDQTHDFPNIELRDVLGEVEAYVRGTGLAVWEIAWIGRAYGGDLCAIAEHTGADRTLLEEGLRYAAEHFEQTDEQISRHTERSLEELLAMFPGMRVTAAEPDEPDGYRL